MIDTPFEQIKKQLIKTIPANLQVFLPRKWEKIGEVVIIKIPENLLKYKEEIGQTYAEVLKCKSTLNDVKGIRGELRKPGFELIYGSKNTETVHKENGISYKLDPRKIMFSSGNMDERIRMGKIVENHETVVDLFAGIGYFTLPIAVHCHPKRVFSCEKNPLSYKYLCQNIVRNHVTHIVKPLLGDNRETAPCDTADRVVMGYIKKTEIFLPTAFKTLKKNGGMIHFHNVYPDEDVPLKPLRKIKSLAEKHGYKSKLIKFKHIKNYAPGISHYVFDIKIW